MKSYRVTTLCFAALAPALLLSGCYTVGTGAARNGITLIEANGRNRPITPEEIDVLSGIECPYYIQTGDVLDLSFKVRTMRAGQVPWDYRIEVGDSMEARLLPGTIEPGSYKLETGDVVGISFLENWQMNVTRTVRTDGMITAPDVGDVLARGRTTNEVRSELKKIFIESGLIEGDPRITVNVDFVNLDRYEEMSRDVVVRPDGAIRLPGIDRDLRVAGLTIAEAAQVVGQEASQVLRNKPKVSLIIFPAVDTNILADMSDAVQVAPDGRVSIAHIGEMQATGFSLDEMTYALEKACQGLVFNPVDPSVSLLKATGGRVYVGGQVATPGVYQLEAAPSALQAVMIANGFRETSRLNNVIVIRRNPNGKPYLFKTNLRVALKGNTDNDIRLRPFDLVFVPRKTISKMDLFVEQYIDRLVPFDNTLGINAQYYMNEQEVRSKGKTSNFNFNTGVTGLADLVAK